MNMLFLKGGREELPSLDTPAKLPIAPLSDGLAAGLMKLGLVGLDGVKVKAAAGKHKAMSNKRMNEEAARLQEQVQELLRRAEKAKQQAEAISPENKSAGTQQSESLSLTYYRFFRGA